MNLYKDEQEFYAAIEIIKALTRISEPEHLLASHPLSQVIKLKTSILHKTLASLEQGMGAEDE